MCCVLFLHIPICSLRIPCYSIWFKFSLAYYSVIPPKMFSWKLAHSKGYSTVTNNDVLPTFRISDLLLRDGAHRNAFDVQGSTLFVISIFAAEYLLLWYSGVAASTILLFSSRPGESGESISVKPCSYVLNTSLAPLHTCPTITFSIISYFSLVGSCSGNDSYISSIGNTGLPRG